MYCLDCGTKIDEDEPRCPHCGSSVAEMKERIAEAEEKVAYADAVAPSETSKLPLVSERTYTDKDGNPLDPAKEVDVDEITGGPDDLRAIPAIGDADPYITKPMQRIVDDAGEVVADVDRTPKEYRQKAPRRRISIKRVGAVLGILFLVFCFVYVNFSTWFNVFTGDPIDWDASEALEQQAEEDAAAEGEAQQDSAEDEAAQERADFADELDRAYTDLGAWREDVDGVVEDLEGYYLVQNRDTRGEYADACVDLLDEVTASREELASAAASLDPNDGLMDSYDQINELYGYLIDRLEVVYQCWEASLSYDDPHGHESDILAPIRGDLENGSSASEAHFDELYLDADPSAN